MPRNTRKEARQIVDEAIDTTLEGLVHVAGALREYPGDSQVEAAYDQTLAQLDLYLSIQERLRPR